MAGEQRHDVWAAGDAYEAYVGRWSRAVADRFLGWLAVPAGLDWLDVGCGTGALSQLILKSADPRTVLGIDQAAGFIGFAQGAVTDRRASFQTGDAQALPVADGSFGCVVSGLVLNFVPDPSKAVSEMRRAARSGATVAAYVWDYAGEMQLMRRFWDAAAALDPAARSLDEGVRFPVCRPEEMARLFAAAGLRDVAAEAFNVPTVFRDFDDYWSPFLGGQGPAPGYCMSLSEANRARLRDTIKSALPIRPDSSIPMTARAWAVRSVKE